MCFPIRHCVWLLTLCLLGAASGADDKPASVADGDLAAFVTKRITDWQPTTEERRFDEIGWVKSVLEGEQLAKQHNRPLFWFTHDGKMSEGRC